MNHRTSRQIRRKSDLLLPTRLLELDGSEEDRAGVQSVFEGPAPLVRSFDTIAAETGAAETGVAETGAAGQWIGQALREGIEPGEIGVLVRSGDEFDRARAAIEAAGQGCAVLADRIVAGDGAVVLATMHAAKGLEFRAVAVMACDAAVLPSERRLLEAPDETALEEIYATERRLLYVSATRARERLWVSGMSPVSEFIEDIADHAG